MDINKLKIQNNEDKEGNDKEYEETKKN